MFTHQRLISPPGWLAIHISVLTIVIMLSNIAFSQEELIIDSSSNSVLFIEERGESNLLQINPIYFGKPSASIEFAIESGALGPFVLAVFGPEHQDLHRELIDGNTTFTARVNRSSFYFRLYGDSVRSRDQAAALRIRIRFLELFDDIERGSQEAVNFGTGPAWHSFATLRQVDADRAVPKEISDLAKSVVRLHTPTKPICDQSSRRDFSTSGCTAWRFSETLFATAAHCLKDGQATCDRANVTFGYNPPDNKGERYNREESASWGEAVEQCTKVEYWNHRLDFALFRISTDSLSVWRDYKPLPIRWEDAFPLITKDSSLEGDRLVVVHHPKPRQCGSMFNRRVGNAYLEEDWRKAAVYDGGFQTGHRFSAYGSGKAESCRVWVVDQSGGSKSPISRNGSGRIQIPMGRKAEVRDLCDEVISGRRPSVAVLHRCDTCAGTSGAPLFSIEDQPGDDRLGTVVGVHLGAFDAAPDNNGLIPYRGNYALRISKIGDCLDLKRSVDQDRFVASEDATKYAVCKAVLPESAPHRDCGTEVDGDCLPFAEFER